MSWMQPRQLLHYIRTALLLSNIMCGFVAASAPHACCLAGVGLQCNEKRPPVRVYYSPAWAICPGALVVTSGISCCRLWPSRTYLCGSIAGAGVVLADGWATALFCPRLDVPPGDGASKCRVHGAPAACVCGLVAWPARLVAYAHQQAGAWRACLRERRAPHARHWALLTR